jgi:hypothetical protein
VKQLISNAALENIKISIDNRFDDAKDGDNCRIIVDKHETDLMSFVVAFGKPEFLEHLIDFGFDDLDQSVSDHAWKNKNYGNVLLLLNCNSPFPQGFNIPQISDVYLKKEIKKSSLREENCTKQLKKTSLRLCNTSLISIKL